MFEKDPLRDLMLIAAATELVVFAVWMGVAWRRRCWSRRVDVRLLGVLDRAADHPARTTLALTGVSLAMCVLLGVVYPVLPRVHDEFSYLLAGDTFAQGRLANESPAKPRHFESEHILVEPVYASKYPPAQGLALAFGQVIGSPAIGVWVTTACAVGACYWMLCAWTRRRWAVAGALFGLMSGPMLVWWGHSYWGGSVAAIGGALLYGSVARLVAERAVVARSMWLSVVMGVSLGILANSRPYEGLLLSLPAGVWLAWALVGRIPRRIGVVGIIGPTVLVLAAIAWAMGTYNRSITGDPLRAPYQLHADTYSVAPTFVFQEPSQPRRYSHRHIEDFHNGWEIAKHRAHRTPGALVSRSLSKLGMFMWFFLGMPLTVCCGILLLSPGWRRAWRGVRWGERWPVVAAVGLTGVGLVLVTWFSPHYAAPAMGAMLLVVVSMMRRFRARGPRWRGVPAALLVARLGSLLVVIPAYAFTLGGLGWPQQRQALIGSLAQNDGRDLVIVRHGRRYTPHENWVYNPADFGSADVLFAWELDTPSNGELLRSYPDRTAWLLTLYAGDVPKPPLADLQVVAHPPYPRPPHGIDRYPVLPTARVTGSPVGAGVVSGMVITDIDSDGREDVVCAADTAGVRVLADGGGARQIRFRGRPSHLIASDSAWGPSGGIIASVPGAGLVHFVDRGPAGRVRTVALDGRPRYVSFADYDGDGRPEVLVARPEAGVVTVLDPRVSPPAVVGDLACIAGPPVMAEGADIDGDGRMEVVVIEGGGGSGGGGAGGMLHVHAAGGGLLGSGYAFDEPSAMLIADLDSDGDSDVVVADAGTDLVTVLWGEGDGLAAPECFEVGVEPMGLLVGDVDGDGREDLIVGTRYGHGLFVLRGLGPSDVRRWFSAAAPVTLGRRTWFADKATAMAIRSDGEILACTPGVLHRVRFEPERDR